MRPDDAWWRHAVIYQIYLRSFADSNGDGIGDLAGVTSRLDYLADLGVDAVWLTPFYPSPWADGGYDVADFRDIDPMLGTLGDFDTMVGAAHQRGIRVLTDMVPNHTSEDHPWFQRALASQPGSSERARYIFRDGQGTHSELPPSNWRSRFGGSAWTRVPDGQWYLHLFAPEQPDLNWDNEEVRAEFLDILRFWIDRGVDGFRVDVAHGLMKDLTEPLRDISIVEGGTGMEDVAANPDHPYWDRPETHEIYRSWRKALDSREPPRIAVAEASLPGERRMRYARPDELHQAFNFEFLRCPWDANAYRAVVTEGIRSAESVGSVNTWVLSNHDVLRHASTLGLPAGVDKQAWLLSDGTEPPADLELGRRRARAAILFELALPGSAYLYQGEELGLPEVADLPEEVLEDPQWERTGHARKGRDGCRVPMPWNREGGSHGFSTRAGWLPQPPGWARLSVQAQHGDPRSMLELYRSAIGLRTLFADDQAFSWDARYDSGDVLAFRRGSAILVLVNTGRSAAPLPAGEVLLASEELQGPEGEALPGNAAVWLRTPRFV